MLLTVKRHKCRAPKLGHCRICGSQNTSSGCRMHEAICNKKTQLPLGEDGLKNGTKIISLRKTDDA
jgi:hypothetical protein